MVILILQHKPLNILQPMLENVIISDSIKLLEKSWTREVQAQPKQTIYSCDAT